MNVIERWFGAEEGWERPVHPGDRARDLRWAVLAFAVCAVGTELLRSAGGMAQESAGIGWQYLGLVSLAAVVVLRRTAPIPVMLVAGVHMVVVGQLMPVTASSLPVQMLYFFLFFSGVAWARDRRALVGATGAVLVLMTAWLAWYFALGSGLTMLREGLGEDVEAGAGLLPPVVGMVLYLVLINVIYFGFAIGLGQVAWRGARRTAQVVDQAGTIEAQSLRLRDQAVVDERLRIARELHDVVAHHVSVMGVQAAAARRVMDRDPDAARQALGAVERSSRDAVGQMRDLLGTLRAGDPAAADRPGPAAAGARAPQPLLGDLIALGAESSTPTCQVEVTVVESADGAVGRVPPPVQLSVYRIVQEALSNVRRHSTARRAGVTVRVDEAAGTLEVEVVDDGTARVGTSGGGLGLRGMRERAQLLGGQVDVGPRTGHRGWRVRAQVPLDGSRSTAPPAQALR